MKEMEYLKELTGRYPVLEEVKENILGREQGAHCRQWRKLCGQ